LGNTMSVFKMEKAFYLQDTYVRDWMNDSILFFLEVDNIDDFWSFYIPRSYH
jgi:hypothetical protein